MDNQCREKIADALWKVICTVRTNLGHGDFHFSEEDVEFFRKDLRERIFQVDLDHGDRYHEYNEAASLMASVMWIRALNEQWSKIYEAMGLTREKLEESERIARLRRMETYFVENVLRRDAKSSFSAKLGRVTHLSENNSATRST